MRAVLPLLSTAVLLLVVVTTRQNDAAKILALLPTPSPSHHYWNRALLLALAAKGHQVTVFGPNAEDKPVANLRHVVVEGLHEEMSRRYDYVSMAHTGYLASVGAIFRWGREACEATLKSAAARRLLDMAAAKETFDLVIVEVTLVECVFGFVERFGNPPVLGVTAYGLPPWAQQVVGNPINPSYMNTYLLPFADRMNFPQRAANAFFHLYTTFYRDLVHIPQHDRIAREFFGEGATSVADAERRVSMVLANHHFSFDYPQPYVPALVPIGGMHTKDPEPLPQVSPTNSSW